MKILISRNYYGQYFQSLHDQFPCDNGRILEIITSKKVDPIFTCHKLDKSVILEALGVSDLLDEIKIYVINDESVFSPQVTKSESFVDVVDEMIKSYVQGMRFDLAICYYEQEIVNKDNTILVENRCSNRCSCYEECYEYHLYVNNGEPVETSYYCAISRDSFIREVGKLVKSLDIKDLEGENTILKNKIRELHSMVENI